MLQTTRDVDHRLVHALDAVGVVGQRLRDDLLHDLKSKIVLRRGTDPVAIIGDDGSGKRLVAEAVHTVATDVLGRSGQLHTFDCGPVTGDAAFHPALSGAIDAASGGTLLLERFDTLTDDQRTTAARLMRARSEDALFLAARQSDANVACKAATAIRIKPLHEREEDIWELVDHFFAGTVEDLEVDGGRGFSRQAKADIAEVVQETGLASVRRLQDIVRDLVFGLLADGPLPLKITSEQVRPYLEANFQQTAEGRAQRDADLVASLFDTLEQQGLAERLAGLHNVSEDLLGRQAQIIREVIDSIDDVPQSYRNVMTKMDDIQRASLWLMTGASTQAAFRRYFGDEGFMRPTKSVAWAFYNRVFRRDM